IYENGSWRADNTVAVGDVLKISREMGVIQYSKNGVVLYESTMSVPGSLTVEAALIDVTASVAHARITAPAGQPPFVDGDPSVDPRPTSDPTPTPMPSPSPMVARHRFCGWTMATGYVT